tara:strand:+ start:3506 stop:3700 length:195 start_codon:yes stop_codon:yes gene_type:complete
MEGEAGSSELARQCKLSCISVVLQFLLAILFVLGSLWLASLLLEPLRILGITTIPPGIAYVDYE